MLTHSRVIKHKIELLSLAEEFQNILKNPKIRGGHSEIRFIMRELIEINTLDVSVN